MKNDPEKGLRALLKKIDKTDAPDLPSTDDAMDVLVLSFLMWESTTEKAVEAYDRLVAGIVDYNDLRVSMPHETVELIGERYPAATDRAERMRACLRDIYLREHGMTLERLAEAGKRDARKYLESLEGIVPYVASRVLLLCYGTHAIPVDEQLRTALISADAADEALDVADLSTWLSRQVRASAGLRTHYALQAWAEKQGGTKRSSGTRKKKKTTRKKTKKTPASRRKTTKKKKTSRSR